MNASSDRLLRRTLWGNAVFSTISGAVGVALATPFAAWATHAPVAFDDYGVGTADGRRFNLRMPAAVGAGDGGGGFSLDLDAHRLAGCRPSPERVRFSPLHHHMVAEHRADERAGRGGGRNGRMQRREESEQDDGAGRE